MHVLEIKEFGLLSYHDNLKISKEVMKESVDLVINSHLFEDYSDHEYKRALKFQNMIRRHVYG
jgi:predicted SAM-dependent methyltransferase